MTLALSGIFIHDPDVKVYLVAAEFAIIVTILVTWSVGITRQWHRRWLEYRRLAECLRHMRILAPLGAEGPISRPGLDVDGQDWVSWYAWSLRRLIPLPYRVVDQAYIAAMQKAVRSAEIAGQSDYHLSQRQKAGQTRNAHAPHRTGAIRDLPARYVRSLCGPLFRRTFFRTPAIRITPRLSALFPMARVRIAF